MLFGKKKANNKLIEIILQACDSNSKAYGEDCYRLFKEVEGFPDAIADAKIEEIATKVRAQYFTNVENSVIYMYQNDPVIISRIMHFRDNPSDIGWEYSDIDPEKPVGAGTLYLICYYAIIGEIAEPSMCIALNHKQAEIMEEALQYISRKYNIQ